MAILVTGGAGYIGSHTVVALVEAGLDVVIVDNFSNSSPQVLERLEMICKRSLPNYPIDVADEDALRAVFQQHDFEAVIHFAAYKAVGESVAMPIKYYQNNLNTTLSLLKVMEEFQVKSLVYSSSATVYGEDNLSPLNEAMPIGSASNPYGYTKIFNEQILADLFQSDPSWRIGILRYFNPIGAHESGLIGEAPNALPNNLMPYLLKVASGEIAYLTVFGDDYPTPDGSCVRDYIHVMDLAEGHLAMLSKLQEASQFVRYNLGTGIGYSVIELINTFQSENAVPIPYVIGERRPGDLAIVYADPTKAEAELNWSAQRILDEMCQDSWRWQKKNPHGYERPYADG